MFLTFSHELPIMETRTISERAFHRPSGTRKHVTSAPGFQK